MDNTYHVELQQHSRLVRVRYEYDSYMGHPWKKNDGHGPVRDSKYNHSSHAGKKPWERPLGGRDRNSQQHFYDWREAMKLAKRDGWYAGCVNTFMHLTFLHKRVPTKGMIAEYAVEKDYQYLQSWCNDEWHWCIITVEDVETGVERSLGDIESENTDNHHEEIIKDMVDDMYQDVVKALLNGVVQDDEAA